MSDAQHFIDSLSSFGAVLAIKLYRMTLERPPGVPVLPCLDHEAMLHGGIPPHMALYLQTRVDGGIHELVFMPARRQANVDVMSTFREHSPDSHREVLALLARALPEYRVTVGTPSWWRGDRRVAEACRAHVSLRDVLLGADLVSVKAAVDRLQTIGTLMEKNSRVASWGVRTVTGPLLAAAGVVTFQVMGALVPRIGETGVTTLRSALIGTLGAVFLYYGLKAVQLTDMANRVWKRAAEYNLILAERRRLIDDAARSVSPPGPGGPEGAMPPRR